MGKKTFPWVSSKSLKLLQLLERFESNGRAINRRKKKKRELEKRGDNNALVRGVNQPRYSRDRGKCVRARTYMRMRNARFRQMKNQRAASLICAARNYPFLQTRSAS